MRLDEAAYQFVIEASLSFQTNGYYSDAGELALNVVRMIYARNSYEADELLTWHPNGF